MPQMAPLSWLSLMIMFIITIFLFNMMIYYMPNKKIINKQKMMLKPSINWKW